MPPHDDNDDLGFVSKTVWPSGLRRWLQAPVRTGVGSNPTAVSFAGSAGAQAPPNMHSSQLSHDAGVAINILGPLSCQHAQLEMGTRRNTSVVAQSRNLTV